MLTSSRPDLGIDRKWSGSRGGGGRDNPAVNTCVGEWDGDHLIMWGGIIHGVVSYMHGVGLESFYLKQDNSTM